MESEAQKGRRTATVRERGQLTIPAEVRKEARLGEGAVVEFDVREDGVMLRPRIALDEVELDDVFVRQVITATTAGYEELRSDDEQWASEQSERAVLDGSTGDGLGR